MRQVRIGNKVIGSSNPPFVIAEVGINHEGSLEKALEMVDAAAKAGADCVKFQSHITDAEMIQTDMKPGDISDESLWSIMKRCELTADEEIRIKERCEERGIMYLCTPFSREAADRLEKMGVPGYKIGSGECNNIPLIRHIATFGKPIILSTGMNDMTSIRNAVRAIEEYDCEYVLMHCTSAYPTPYSAVRLGAVTELLDAFDCPVGLSDHSIGIWTCLGAVALGANALEKHFTISRQWPGPDISISIEPQELAQLVEGSRAIYAALGGTKDVLDIEKPVAEFAYASVVSIKEIHAGEVFDNCNTWVKRPGNGPIPAFQLDTVLGKVAARDIPCDRQISWEDVSAGPDESR